MDALMGWAKNIIYCIFLIKLLDGFIMDKDFSKYFNFIGGIIMMMMILKPVISFAEGEYSVEYSVLRALDAIDNEAFLLNQQMYGEFDEHLDLKLYKRQLIQRTESLITDDDYDVIRIDLSLSDGVDYGTPTQLNIDVKIKDEIIQEQNNNQVSKDSLKIYYKKNIENQLIDFYNLDGSNININVD